MRIGIDIMGGVFAPQKTIEGTVLSMDEIASGTEIVLFGIKEKILEELKKHNINKGTILLVHFSPYKLNIKLSESIAKVINMGPDIITIILDIYIKSSVSFL